MAYFAPRSVNTSVGCPLCKEKLDIRRSCTEVHMHCPACKKNFPLKDFIDKADRSMEEFLENVYIDRI